MKSLTISIAWSLSALSFIPSALGALPSANFTFEPVIDTHVSTNLFASALSLNDSGQVAVNQYVSGGQSSILLWSHGQMQTIVQSGAVTAQGTNLGAIALPVINNAGAVAFVSNSTTSYPNGANAIYLMDHGLPTLVAPSAGTRDAEWLNINNSDVVGFLLHAPADNDLYAFHNGQTYPIALSATADRLITPPVLNDSGVFAFVAETSSGAHSINTGSGGPLTVIAAGQPLNRPNDPYADLSPPDIASDGTVVFASRSQLGSSIWMSQGGTLTKLIDSNTSGFLSFDYATITDSHKMIFQGFPDAGRRSIYSGFDPVADRILSEGDTLNGSVVSALLDIGRVNNVGQFLTSVSFTDGKTGVFLVTPVPEPETARLVVAAAGVFVVVQVGRVRRTRCWPTCSS